jgi:predicted alpha/beta superfamily hydrolase
MKKIASLFLLLVNGWITAQNNPAPGTTRPFQIGVIETIASKELSENRTLNIYLPYGYHKDSARAYPVIYLLDGSVDEDFIHIVGLVQNFSFPWIAALQPSIVVGIANVDRKRDFSFPSDVERDKKECPTSGGSEKFMAFIEKEVQSFIEKNYKTTASRTLIGESFGGLFAAAVLLKRPALFNTYIIVSPSFWWNNGSLLTQQGSSDKISKLNFQPGTRIYVGVGKEGAMPGREKWVMETTAKQFAENLEKSKNKNIRVVFDYLPDETHATVTHHAVYNAFKLLNKMN